MISASERRARPSTTRCRSPAGEPGREPPAQPGKAKGLQDLLQPLFLHQPACVHSQGKEDIFLHRKPRKKRPLLEHQADMPAPEQRPFLLLHLPQVPAQKEHLPLIRLLQTRQQMDEGRLSCAGDPGKGRKRPFLQPKTCPGKHRFPFPSACESFLKSLNFQYLHFPIILSAFQYTIRS